MVREIFEKMYNRFFIQSPSKEFSSYIQEIQEGKNPEIPISKEISDFQFFGRKKDKESGRLIVIQGQAEKSYVITRNRKNGTVKILEEGLFPRSDNEPIISNDKG